MPLDSDDVEYSAGELAKTADILPRQIFHLSKESCVSSFYNKCTVSTEPEKLVFNASFDSPDESDKKRSVQIRQISLIKLAKLAKTKAELRALFLEQAVELYILHYVKHPNLMRALFTEASESVGQYSIVTHRFITLRIFAETAYEASKTTGSSTLVYRSDIMNRTFVWYIVSVILSTLEWMHCRRIYHNNICVDSVYLDANAKVVIGDFETVTVMSKKAASKQDYYQDVWGAGVVMAFLHHYEFLKSIEKRRDEISSWKFIFSDIFQQISNYVRNYLTEEKHFYEKILSLQKPANAKTLGEHVYLKTVKQQQGFTAAKIVDYMEDWNILPQPYISAKTYTDHFLRVVRPTPVTSQPNIHDSLEKRIDPGDLVNVHVGLHRPSTMPPFEEQFLSYSFSFKPRHEHQILSGIMRLTKIANAANRSVHDGDDSLIFQSWDTLTLRMIIEKGVDELLTKRICLPYRAEMSDKRFMVVHICIEVKEFAPYPDDTSFLHQTLDQGQLL